VLLGLDASSLKDLVGPCNDLRRGDRRWVDPIVMVV